MKSDNEIMKIDKIQKSIRMLAIKPEDANLIHDYLIEGKFKNVENLIKILRESIPIDVAPIKKE